MGIAELGIQPQSPLKQTFAKRPAAVSSFTEATVPKNPVICVICGWGPMTLRWIAVFCVTGAATIVGTPQSPAQARLTVVSTDIASNAAVKTLIATLRDQADEFVFLSGGASGMSDEAQRQLIAMFEALTQLAKGGRRLAVGDGGTYAGIMRAAGEARRASGNAFLLSVWRRRRRFRRVARRRSTPITHTSSRSTTPRWPLTRRRGDRKPRRCTGCSIGWRRGARR